MTWLDFGGQRSRSRQAIEMTLGYPSPSSSLVNDSDSLKKYKYRCDNFLCMTVMQIAPENTVIAFEYAADNDVLAFESDVSIR